LPPGAVAVEVKPTRLRRGVPLSGTVVVAGNRPVAWAGVEAAWVVKNGGRNSFLTAVADADEHGEFTFAALPGLDVVSLTAGDGTRGNMKPLIAMPGQPDEDRPIRFLVEPAGMISMVGRVLGPDGRPVRGVGLRVLRVPTLPGNVKAVLPTEVGLKNYQQIVTDAAGKFRTPHRLTRLATYSVRVASPEYEPTTIHVPVPEDSATEVTVPDIMLVPVKN
jgi:hypothetical protein